MLKIFPASLQQYRNWELPDVQVDLEKAEDPEIKCQHLLGHRESKGIPEEIFTSASLTVCVMTNWKILEMGAPDHLTCLLRNLYAGQEATVRTRHIQWTSSKLGKEYIKAVYCHPAYLIPMQSISREMPGWMNHKLESRLPRETSTTSDMQMIPP